MNPKRYFTKLIILLLFIVFNISLYSQTKDFIISMNAGVPDINNIEEFWFLEDTDILVYNNTTSDVCSQNTGTGIPDPGEPQVTCLLDNDPGDDDIDASCDKDADWRDGVTTLDILFLRLHLLGIQLLDSWRLVAADVENDGDVGTADILEIRRLIIHDIDEFSAQPETWRFANIHHLYFGVGNLSDFEEDPFQTSLDYPNYLENGEHSFLYGSAGIRAIPFQHTSFAGVKCGDLNISASCVPGLGNRHEYSGDTIALISTTDDPEYLGNWDVRDLTTDMGSLSASTGDTIKVTVAASDSYDVDSVGGVQMGWDVNASYLNFVDMSFPEFMDGDTSNYHYDTSNDELRMSWTSSGSKAGINMIQDTLLYVMRFEVEQNINNYKDYLSTDDNILVNEAYTYNTGETASIELEVSAEIQQTRPIAIPSDIPVHLINNTLYYTAELDGNAKISITNVEGIPITSMESYINSGVNSIYINRTLPAGIYIIFIEYDSGDYFVNKILVN